MPAWLVRPARPDDAAGILAIHREAAAERRAIATWPEEVRTAPAEQQRIREWKPEDGGVLVAEDGGEVVGFVALRRGAHRAERHTGDLGLTVAARRRGHGVGRALMLAAEARAREIGIQKLTLGVFADNEAAHALYRSLGYEQEGRRRAQFLVGDELKDEIMMAKWLE
ncbi:MAG: GNAT family N-acetyltransferase [Thermoplasmatota archaeon]